MRAPLSLLAILFLFFSPHRAVAGEAAGSPEDVVQSGEETDDELMEDLFGDEEEEVRINDPLESFNRAIFWVNDKIYFKLAKPVARGWRALAPEKVRISLGNFISNLFAPVRAANCLLQGKVEDFGNEIGRFMVNTTVGVLGFSDRAKKMTGIGPKNEDFGQTLGVWGFGHGFYLVLPVLGPSSLRDGTGIVGDFLLDPLYWSVPERKIVYISLKAGNYVNAISLDKDTYEGIKRQAIDPYLFVRNAYAQKRRSDTEK